ncbi:hypothetical protein MRX96_039196 [Rhipicephalus microplus]
MSLARGPRSFGRLNPPLLNAKKSKTERVCMYRKTRDPPSCEDVCRRGHKESVALPLREEREVGRLLEDVSRSRCRTHEPRRDALPVIKGDTKGRKRNALPWLAKPPEFEALGGGHQTPCRARTEEWKGADAGSATGSNHLLKRGRQRADFHA